eukprot:6892651-Alexandrium_andersonii.AAC.1
MQIVGSKFAARCVRDKRSAAMLRAQGARWQELAICDLTELREESIALWSLIELSHTSEHPY